MKRTTQSTYQSNKTGDSNFRHTGNGGAAIGVLHAFKSKTDVKQASMS
jgi:hypothetical protein